MHKVLSFASCILMIILVQSCGKEQVYSDNPIPPNATVSTLLVEQYVNRCFVDLIGRSATNSELNQFATTLESDNFSVTSRKNFLATIQQTDGLKQQYLQQVYVDMKARYLDGLSEDEIEEEANFWLSQALQAQTLGDALAYNLLMLERNKLMSIINMALYWEDGAIDYSSSAKTMMFNSLYDDLNMGTFNFIYATFDQNFYREPTNAEYDGLYATIEYNGPGFLFQQNISNKSEMLDVLINSIEFKEGLVRWFYRSYLVREPDAVELAAGINYWSQQNDFNSYLQILLSDDEYAGITE